MTGDETSYGIYKGKRVYALYSNLPAYRRMYFRVTDRAGIENFLRKVKGRNLYFVELVGINYQQRPPPIQTVLTRFKRAAVFRHRVRKGMCSLLQRARMARLREELVAAAWHPRRVAAWLEAGVELEDL